MLMTDQDFVKLNMTIGILIRIKVIRIMKHKIKYRSLIKHRCSWQLLMVKINKIK